MVGPTPDAEYEAAMIRLLVGFVLFVGISSMLAAFYGGATLVEIGILGLSGVAVGVVALLAMGAWPSRGR